MVFNGLRLNCRGLPFIAIPDSVNSLGGRTFKDCSGLISVSIGEGLNSLDSPVFEDCTSLKSALFQGNSPAWIDQETFADTAPSFTVYYLSGKTGVTYTVETSTNLQHWTTNGATLTDLDSDRPRTASVPLDSHRRFLRLVVSEKPAP